MKTISFEQFKKYYKLQQNPFTENGSYDNCAFETYDSELTFVKQFDNNRIWTLLSCDNEESWIIPGYHFVNRQNYFVTEIPWEDTNIQVNDNEILLLDEAINYCISCGETIFNMGFDKNDVTLHFNENVDFTFDGKITIGKAKYTAMSYYEDRLEKNIEEFEDELHDYYSQL